MTSVFSDAFTDVAGTDFNPSWGQSTVVTTEVVAADNVLKYANLNYQGTQFAAALDVSGKSTMHVDYWTADGTSLQLFLINSAAVTGAAAVETAYTFTITNNSWTGVDIPLSTFTGGGVDLTQVDQMKVVGDGTVYLDNLYFY